MKPLCSVYFYLLVTASFVIGAEEKVVVCYYGTWAAYRPGLGKFEVTDIPTDLCTHLVYTFAGIDYSGNVVSLDPYLDYAENWGKDYLRKFNALKKTNPHLKTILAVGGFNEGSEKYSLMASNPQLRRNFIISSINMLTKYGFNGLEVDWEYPNRGNSIYGQDDINNFSQLLKELREEFDKRGLLLTGAVAAVENFAKLSYSVSAISSYLDLVSIMTYDMYGPWDPVTGHNAPVHMGDGDEDIAPENVFSVDSALQYWLKQVKEHNAPLHKGDGDEDIAPDNVFSVDLALQYLVEAARLPAGETGAGYAAPRKDVLSSEDSSVRAPSSGTGLAGPYTQTRGLIGYNELCHKFLMEPWDVRQDNLAKVPYAVQRRNWVSYDDSNSLVAKIEYGLQYGIAGIMVWSIETDDFYGICRNGEFPLLRSVNAALGRTA